MALGNFGDADAEPEIALQPGRLGLTGRLSATDAVARTPVTIGDNGRFRLTVPARDFRMVLVEAAYR